MGCLSCYTRGKINCLVGREKHLNEVRRAEFRNSAEIHMAMAMALRVLLCESIPRYTLNDIEEHNCGEYLIYLQLEKLLQGANYN